MASGLYRRKMHRLFQPLDMTNDGFLDRADFDLVVGAMIATSPATDAGGMREATDALWEMVLRTDGDGDGRITSSEFVDAMDRGMRAEDRFDEVMGPIGEVWFNLYDADGDGGITLSEYMAGMQAHRSELADHTRGFEVLDVNGSGVVARAEWIARLKEYCTTDDPDAAGNMILGPLPG